MTVRPVNLLLGMALLLTVPLTATAQEQETLDQRYQETIDTVIARLQLADSAGQQFRTSVAQYLAETEKIFAEHEGTVDRASMEAMTKELDDAREGLDRQLETFLSKDQVAQVRTIMDDLRRQTMEVDSDSGL
ncbi:MAG: hypothetical protein E2O47_05375 [Gemmatimonadetes bacterium]|nr:MAG: hypothetical protein E2O47_05375 [Gemmatimonadota bacterium]